MKDGAVELNKILIPIDHRPDSQTALSKASLLARGLGSTAGEVRLVQAKHPVILSDMALHSLGISHGSSLQWHSVSLLVRTE